MWEFMLDFFLPKKCVGCGSLEVCLCEECRDKLEFANQICPECGEESVMGWTHDKCRRDSGMDGLIVLYEYEEETMRRVIEGIKFGFNRELVSLVLRDMIFETGVIFDSLVPLPLFFYRENWRGFNQSEVIAEVIGNKMNLPVSKSLKRVKMTKQQSLIKSKEGREENVKNAFRILDGRENVFGKKILLVDDVFTSGADMRECTRVLKEAGADNVWGIVLAH